MNTKLSGAQLVLVPIQRLGRNYFPFVENINRRIIKYIDFAPAQYLPDTDKTGTTSTDNMYITVLDAVGNSEIQRNLPLERLNYKQTLGIRNPLFSKINLEASYVDCQNENMVGTTAAFVFWYDLPEYSSRNTTDTLITDSVSIPLVTYIRYNQFPDSDRMVGKRFRRLLLSAPSVTPDLHTGITLEQTQNIYLTLRKGSYCIVDNLPLSLLYQLQMLTKTEFQNIIFDFQASYLTIGGAGTISNVQADYIGKSVFMNLQYEK